MYLVQVGRDTRSSRGSYKTKYAFPDKSRALLYYFSINLGNGYKRRLVAPDGTVLARCFS